MLNHLKMTTLPFCLHYNNVFLIPTQNFQNTPYIHKKNTEKVTSIYQTLYEIAVKLLTIYDNLFLCS